MISDRLHCKYFKNDYISLCLYIYIYYLCVYIHIYSSYLHTYIHIHTHTPPPLLSRVFRQLRNPRMRSSARAADRVGGHYEASPM